MLYLKVKRKKDRKGIEDSRKRDGEKSDRQKVFSIFPDPWRSRW
jgi:hypothetical protein